MPPKKTKLTIDITTNKIESFQPSVLRYIKPEAKEKMQTKTIENQYNNPPLKRKRNNIGNVFVDNNLENNDLSILENSLDNLKLIPKVDNDNKNYQDFPTISQKMNLILKVLKKSKNLKMLFLMNLISQIRVHLKK